MENQQHSIVIYQTDSTNVCVSVFYSDETFWLTQKAMAELFGVQKAAISKHLKNIFEDGELDEKSVVSILETTADDGKKYSTNYYNLDAIIAVGYRVNSKQATAFRIWATKTLKEYITKGFVLNDDMLKNFENGKLIKGQVLFMELNIDNLKLYSTPVKQVSKFPSVVREYNFLVERDKAYEDYSKDITQTSPYIKSIQVKDIYTGKGVKTGYVSVLISIEYNSLEKTLSAEEIEGIEKIMLTNLKNKYGIEIKL